MGFFPKPRSRIRREASEWVVRLAGQPSQEDRAAFERWRGADQRHAEAYDRVAAIWNHARRLSPAGAPAKRTNGHSEQPRAFRWGLAASLAGAMLLVSALLLGPRWLPGPPPQQATMLFASAWLSAYAQFTTGILLSFGLLTRPAALVVVVNFLVALFMVHRHLPFSANIAPLAMLIGGIYFALAGAPRWSLDAVVARRLRRSPAPAGARRG